MFLAMELRHRAHPARGDAGRGAADPARRARHPRPGAAGARRRAQRRPDPPRRQARERHPARGRRRSRSPTSGSPGPSPAATVDQRQTGVLLGTVAYLSPEQVERGIADARSDVYAAGLLLFEMLTGTKAFSGDTPIHVAYQHVHGTVPRPRAGSPTVPPELDRLVALATARDPDGRPVRRGRLPGQLRRTRSAADPRRAGPAPRPGRRSLGPGRHRGDAPAGGARPRPASRPPAAAATARTAAPPSSARRRLDAAPAPATVPRRRWLLGGARARRRRGRGRARGSSSPARAPGRPCPRWSSLTQRPGAAARSRASHLDGDRSTGPSTRRSGPAWCMTSDPGAGADVRRGSTVRLTVSKGPERYSRARPRRRQPVADAERQLPPSGCRSGRSDRGLRRDRPRRAGHLHGPRRRDLGQAGDAGRARAEQGPRADRRRGLDRAARRHGRRRRSPTPG